MLNCGLDIGSDPAERLFGLRSSSDRDRLMGRVCIVLPMDGVDGGLCWEREDIDGSLDQEGTGGRVRLGERASFLEGCCWWDGVGGWG